MPHKQTNLDKWHKGEIDASSEVFSKFSLVQEKQAPQARPWAALCVSAYSACVKHVVPALNKYAAYGALKKPKIIYKYKFLPFGSWAVAEYDKSYAVWFQLDSNWKPQKPLELK